MSELDLILPGNSRSLNEKSPLEITKIAFHLLLDLTNMKYLKNLPDNEQHSMQTLLQQLIQLKALPKEIEDAIFKNLLCRNCKVIMKYVLSCSCSICEHQLTEFNSALDSKRALTDSSTFFSDISLTCCPVCNSQLTEADLRILIIDYDAYKLEATQTRCRESFREQGWIVCESCKNNRGNNMFFNECAHMCKICICQQLLRHKQRNCFKCQYRFNVKELSLEKMQCCICENEYYLLGDRLLETCPGHLCCGNCMYVNLYQRRCGKCNRGLNKKEKLEIYRYMFTECNRCWNEICISNSVKKICCATYFCRECAGMSSECLKCGRSLS